MSAQSTRRASAARNAAIRRATRADRADIEQLLTSNNLPVAGVSDALNGFLVAESEEQIVGVAGVEHCGAYGLLRSTAVEPSWRSRGLGRQLVEGAIADARARGMKALYLLTTTGERYFPSFGFVQTTREAVPAGVRDTVEFKDACPASATVMMLDLDSSR